MLIFDIETGPLPREELNRLMPEFEADKRLKDPIKIDLDIAGKREDWLDRAALSAVTGQVLAIGACQDDREMMIKSSPSSEADLLQDFWDIIAANTGPIIGFNIKGFDLPFIIRRSWKFKIKIVPLLRGRYWEDHVWDLAELWQLGNHQQYTSLDTICKHLNLGEKNGSGKDFAGLWANDRPKAIEYLTNDIKLTVALYNRLCG